MEPQKSIKGETEEAVSDEKRSVIFNRGEQPVETSVYKRELLQPGMIFKGPAIVAVSYTHLKLPTILLV